jgi:hypothetical protein
MIPVETAVSQRPPRPEEYQRWFEREIIPLLTRLRTFANEQSTFWAAPDASGYEWDMERHGVLFLEPTAGGEISVLSSVNLLTLRAGRRYLLHVYNATGGDITMTFSADFKANEPVIPNGTTSCWEFLVAEGSSTLTERLLEI